MRCCIPFQKVEDGARLEGLLPDSQVEVKTSEFWRGDTQQKHQSQKEVIQSFTLIYVGDFARNQGTMNIDDLKTNSEWPTLTTPHLSIQVRILKVIYRVHVSFAHKHHVNHVAEPALPAL